jgi:DNA-binding NarL/FixJ family response regulator
MSIRVVIADDQELMRSALRMCLTPEPDIEVVGEAVDGRHAIEQTLRLKPDVLLLDIRMPYVNGIDVIRRLMAAGQVNPVKILVITGFDVEDSLVEALRAGASGFLVKDASAQEVVRAVRVIDHGEALLAPSVTRTLLDRYARFLPLPEHRDGVVATLTQRELTVLRLVSRGLGNAAIAESLHIGASSVKSHVGHLLTKLGLADRVHLVIFAYESGLVQPGSVVEEGEDQGLQRWP